MKRWVEEDDGKEGPPIPHSSDLPMDELVIAITCTTCITLHNLA